MERCRRILVADDDDVFVRAFTRGAAPELEIYVASSAETALRTAAEHRPHVAVVDLRLGRQSGITLIRDLRAAVPGIETVLVSAYLSVAYAVAGVRAGAAAILFKPISLAEVLAHVDQRVPGVTPDVSDVPDSFPTPSLARAEWEHITRVLMDCDGNVSAAARRLGIYRQSLQRKLRKHAPRT